LTGEGEGSLLADDSSTSWGGRRRSYGAAVDGDGSRRRVFFLFFLSLVFLFDDDLRSDDRTNDVRLRLSWNRSRGDIAVSAGLRGDGESRGSNDGVKKFRVDREGGGGRGRSSA